MTERSYKQSPGERGVFFSDAYLRLTPATPDTPLSLVGRSEGTWKVPMLENGILFLPYGGSAIIQLVPPELPQCVFIAKYMKERSDRPAGIELHYKQALNDEKRKLLTTLKPKSEDQGSTRTIVVLPGNIAVRVDYGFRSRMAK